MTPDEIRRLNPDYALVLVKGIKPVKAKKYYYFIKPISKELKACEISHNDIGHVVRNEYRIYNPLEKQEAPRFNQAKTNEKVAFDDVFKDEPISTKNNQDFTIDIEEDDDDEMPQIISSKGKSTKKKEEYVYDVQKELEIKFDELFGTAEDE